MTSGDFVALEPEKTSTRREPLRALLVEDNPDDAELVVRALRRGGREPVSRRVETEAEMRVALAEERWDVILSDYTLPTFSGPEAFAVMRDVNLDLPFIIVSGTVGEDTAVDAMRAGVHDFLLKGQLRRLVAAIERELREATMRAERRKIQEQLLISDRMASVGTLAAGVAHEINNPLAVVVGNLEVIGQDAMALLGRLEALPEESRRVLGEQLVHIRSAVASMCEATKDAQEGGQRVRTIVRDLRIFSRSEEETRQAVDVRAVLESSLRMARNELRHRAKVVLRLGDVPRVEANESRLGQVFLNLIINAAQAIPEGNADRNSITITTARWNDMVQIDIADTGSGIPPEVLPHIFDVFFTTKPLDVGTGLGLSICHRIVTAMHGGIDVDSRLGEGTTFRVTLPRAHTGHTAEVPMAVLPGPPSATPRSVLVVEDEAAIGRILQRLLVPHQVTVVTRARAALERLAAGEHFDVIISDLMMPDLTGMDFHAELRRLRPALADQVVFMSGGAFTPATRAFLSTIPNPCLDKPIDATKLRLLVEGRGTPPTPADDLE
jgi:signal transduction histidine kinase